MQFMKAVTVILLAVHLNMLQCFSVNAEDSLTIPGPRSALDISHDYHKQLLIMALTASGKQVTPQLSEQPFVSESRVIAEIKKHKLVDVYWFGADTELDDSLRAIPIPTTRGLIGYRKFIILKKNTDKFDQVQNLKSLGQLTACQGTFWPDTRILKNARLKVTTTAGYEDLFKMLEAGRCDYFPRGVHDHTKEVELRKSQYADLFSYPDILLHYPFGVFFYVAQDNKVLARDLEKGMQALAEQGKIVEFMRTHPLTKHVFPLDKGSNSRFFSIPNPYINAQLNLQNEAHWIQPKEFGIGK